MIIIFDTLEEAIEYSLRYKNALADVTIELIIDNIRTWIDMGCIEDTPILPPNEILTLLIKNIFEKKIAAQIAS